MTRQRECPEARGLGNLAMRPPTFARDVLVSSSSYTDLTERILWICQLDTDMFAQYTKKSVFTSMITPIARIHVLRPAGRRELARDHSVGLG